MVGGAWGCLRARWDPGAWWLLRLRIVGSGRRGTREVWLSGSAPCRLLGSLDCRWGVGQW